MDRRLAAQSPATRNVCQVVWALLATSLLVCTAGLAQPAPPQGKGPCQITLGDANVCLSALGEAEKALTGQDAAKALPAAGKVFEQAKAAAGQALAVPVPGDFSGNLGAGPYLQIVDDKTALVRWAALQTDTTVRYGTNGQLTSTARATRLPWPRWMHQAALTGLAPGAEYTYGIRVGQADVQGSFRTAPAGDGAFGFAVWGDSQCYPDVFSGVAIQMAKQRPDLAICTGDAVEVGLTDGDYYWELFRPAQDVLRDAFLLSAVGNHELFGDDNLARRGRFVRNPNPGKTYYALTYANCRFIVLDSNDKGLAGGPSTGSGPPLGVSGAVPSLSRGGPSTGSGPPLGVSGAVPSLSRGGEQLEWLKGELASDACAKARFRFLLLHHAPFCWDWYGGDSAVQQSVVPLAENAKVDVFFAGHFHCYERGSRKAEGGQTFYVVNGGGAGDFTTPERGDGPGHHDRDFMVKHEWKHHFVSVTIDGAGLKARALDDKGQGIDEFEIKRPAAGMPAPAGAAPAARSAARALAVASTAPAGLAVPPDDARFCTISLADRDAAMSALADCRKALTDKQADLADRLERVRAVLEVARDLSLVNTWNGSVERTVHRVPRLVFGDIRFRLKPSDRADASVRQALDRIAFGDAALFRGRTFEIKGLDHPMLPQRWILVDSIAEKPR